MQLNAFECKWICFIKNTLDNLGLSYIFEQQARGINYAWFKHSIKNKIHDIYEQDWRQSIFENELCRNYRIFKTNFKFEEYLICLPPFMAAIMLTFRAGNTTPNLAEKLFSGNDAECQLCNNMHADEYHYLMECAHFKCRRKGLHDLVTPANTHTYAKVMKSDEARTKLASFLHTIQAALKGKKQVKK